MKTKSHDLWDVSSFNNPSYQKGLITFYQQQWQQTHRQDSDHQIAKNELTEQPKIKDSIKPKKIPLRQLKNIDAETHKSVLRFKKSQPSIKTQQKQTLREIIKPFNFVSKKKSFHTSSLHDIRKQKQNKIEEIEKSILKKPLIKIKQSKTFETVHIQTFPFQDKSQDQNDLSKISVEVPNLRIRKGSSFKGFHRQNFSISTVGLSKDILLECHKKVDKSFDQLSKKQSSLGKYLFSREKYVSNYLFPVQNSGFSFFRKINQKRIEQYEDSLNKFCKKLINRREQRNTQIYTVQRDIHS